METREEHYASMMQAITRYAPSADLEVIQRAYEYADEKHKNQLRKSGELYIIHPLAVAEIVAEIGLDTDAITAALLHDCLEDTDASFEEISRMFGETVANLVEGVTKLTRVQYSTMEEQQMENLRKMFMAMSKDIRVILIKIADRLHNMRTMDYQTAEKQKQKVPSRQALWILCMQHGRELSGSAHRMRRYARKTAVFLRSRVNFGWKAGREKRVSSLEPMTSV